MCFYYIDLKVLLTLAAAWAPLTAVTSLAYKAAAAHEGAFKSQMKSSDCETLFVSSARNLWLI